MILSKGKQSMELFWSFFHTIGLNFKTLAHFFTLQSVLIPATESQTQTLIVEV